MSFVIIFLLVIAVLFATVFLTKRRFGVLGLALAAGTLLSSLWVHDLTPVIARAGLVLVKPPLSSVVGAGLILLPPALLLMSGPSYKVLYQRIIGAIAFAILAATLLLEPLGSALVIDDIGKPTYEFFIQNQASIITICLALSIFDLFFEKRPRHHRE